MSETATAPSWFERNHFLLRRLHSLTGVVPVGAFLFNHLLTNATAWLSPHHFNEHVEWLHSLPFLLWIEILFIFVPLAFHAILGVVIALQAKNNPSAYPYANNWRFYLQRVTAWITLVFVVVHLLHFRFAHWVPGGENYKNAEEFGGFFAFTAAGFTLVIPVWAWIIVYSIGTLAAVYHLCNGLVTFCITWGITVNVPSRGKVSIAAAALGLLLMAWGVLSLWALTSASAEHDRRPEGEATAARVQAALPISA